MRAVLERIVTARQLVLKQRARARYQQRRAARLCTACGEPSGDHANCIACRRLAAARYIASKSLAAQRARQRQTSANRRATNRALQRCINHPLTDRAAPHGPVVPGKGGRCEACAEQHRRTR